MKLPSDLGLRPVLPARVEEAKPLPFAAKLLTPPAPGGPSKRLQQPPPPEETQELLSRLPQGALYAGEKASVVLFPAEGARRRGLLRLPGEPRALALRFERQGERWQASLTTSAGPATVSLDPGTNTVRVVSPAGDDQLSVVNDRLARVKNDPQWAWASAALEAVRTGLKERFGISELFIGGGSARALLDAMYLGRQLDMRDLDVFVIAGADVNEKKARTVGEKLESPTVGVFSADDLRPRPRGNPALPEPARSLYNTGYGFFFKHDEDIFDLIMVKTKADLDLNGLFDFDSVLLKVGDEGLESVLGKVAQSSPAELVKSGLLSDAHQGYEHWLSGLGTVAHWAEVEREPASQSLRVARSLTKIGHHEVPSELLPRLRRGVDADDRKTSPLQIVRGFMKILEDKKASAELLMIKDTGVLRRWCPALERLFAKQDVLSMERLIQGGSAEDRLERILGAMPAGDRLRLLRDLRAVKVAADPALVAEHIQGAVAEVFGRWTSGLPGSPAILELVKSTAAPVDFLTEVERITASPTLHASEKRDLLVRAVLRRVQSEERGAVLDAWMPKLNAAKRAQHLEDAATARVGVFTGVINPLHLGHRDMLSAAVEATVLDQIEVVPTPKTQHNETPIDWAERLEMARVGLACLPEAKVVTTALGPAFESGGTAKALEVLDTEAKDRFGKVAWTHVMGADSFERFRDKGYLAGAKAEGKRLFVAERPGYDTPEIPLEYKDMVATLATATQTFGEQARASSVIRKLLAKGEAIDGLVGRSVQQYIAEKGLYAEVKA
ncbi:MAG: hypothetical protein U1E65_27045 [Myxococcota bacterium]